MFGRRKKNEALLEGARRYMDSVYIGEYQERGLGAMRYGQMPQASMPARTVAGQASDAPEAFETTGSFGAVMLDAAAPPSLVEQLCQLDESFAQTVLRLIDERGMRDAEVYKRANMSRQLFAKIRRDDNYRPTKKTACALAFALRLNYEDAILLLRRAGFALSHSSKFDVIVEYCLLNGVHDVNQVNMVLYEFDQQLLG
ncbi:MAG: hypothetical protein V8R08_02345 [Coriobacteriales bacterium]